MKALFRILSTSAALISCSWINTQPLLAAPAFEVNPTSISADFQGNVLFQVSGIPQGQSVRLEKFADTNGNGTVDPEDPLMAALPLITDGQLPRIGGVRNLNLPGDEDALSNGEIRFSLQIPGLEPVTDRIIGRFLYRLSAANGEFTPMTRAVEVTPSSLPQRVSGKVTSAVNGAPLANALVVLVRPDQPPEVSVFTDANGNYSLPAPAGVYSLLAIRAGFVANFSTSQIELKPNTTLTKDVALAAANFTVTGKIIQEQNRQGLPAILISAEEQDSGLFAIAISDASGNFLLNLTAGHWEIEANRQQLAQRGLLAPEHGLELEVRNNVSGVELNAFPVTALIYGQLRDTQNNPVIGARLSADSFDEIPIETETISLAPDGRFALGVRGGNWWVEPDNEQLSTLGFLGESKNVFVSDGQAVSVDFELRRLTARVRGRVVDQNGDPVAGVFFHGHFQPQEEPVSGMDTPQDGSFDIGVFGGTWRFHLGDTEGNGGENDLLDHDLFLQVRDGENIENVIFVAPRSTARITGKIQDANGNGISFVGLHASALINGTQYNINGQTDSAGRFDLGVINGSWNVSLNCFDIEQRGMQCPSAQEVVVNGGNQTVNFTTAPARVTAFLRGQVVDPTGNPVSDMQIFALNFSEPTRST
ncbi:MAG: carboxypeptidase-like regulatory domain-containing protein, partial [Verrucomicrobiota bacterium]